MPRTTAATKRAIWWTVSSRMRDGDAGDDDGAAILERIRPSRLPFSLSILELRRRAIAGRLRRRTSKVPFAFQSFNRFGSMERAPKVCLFVCISSSRDRLKFETPFLKFSNENAVLEPLRPYCGWTANGGGRCECHVRRGVVPFRRGMRELAFFALFSSEMFIFSCSHPP